MANGKQNFLTLLKQHVQDFKNALGGVQAKPSIPGDMNFKNLIEEFAEEFSTKSPGFFPGQIGPRKLVDYHNRFSQYVPGYAGVRISSNYSREVTTHLRNLFDAIHGDLQNPNVEIPWLLDKLGSLFVRGGSVVNEMSNFVGARLDGIERELKGV